ncbi:hypothetical protein EV401DRAFT_1914329 [Pisolithus croceorrhizus]|nr:hypothetical protein EV401DRAFT_1914329 [Pisolithus croceorrhizus]
MTLRSRIPRSAGRASTLLRTPSPRSRQPSAGHPPHAITSQEPATPTTTTTASTPPSTGVITSHGSPSPSPPTSQGSPAPKVLNVTSVSATQSLGDTTPDGPIARRAVAKVSLECLTAILIAVFGIINSNFRLLEAISRKTIPGDTTPLVEMHYSAIALLFAEVFSYLSIALVINGGIVISLPFVPLKLNYKSQLIKDLFDIVPSATIVGSVILHGLALGLFASVYFL